MWLQAQVRLSRSTKEGRKENCLSRPFFQIVKGAIRAHQNKPTPCKSSGEATHRFAASDTESPCRTVEEDPSADGTTRHNRNNGHVEFRLNSSAQGSEQHERRWVFSLRNYSRRCFRGHSAEGLKLLGWGEDPPSSSKLCISNKCYCGVEPRARCDVHKRARSGNSVPGSRGWSAQELPELKISTLSITWDTLKTNTTVACLLIIKLPPWDAAWTTVSRNKIHMKLWKGSH